jgi:hypothetical protein
MAVLHVGNCSQAMIFSRNFTPGFWSKWFGVGKEGEEPGAGGESVRVME